MKRWITRLRSAAMLLVVLAVAACGNDPASAPSADASVDADPACVWRCEGFHSCEDGIVTTWLDVRPPCAEFDGTCPSEESFTCERGCRTDIDRSDDVDLDPKAMCEEHRPKQVGDPCDDEADCRPEVATVDEAGVVTGVYLACDLEAGTCVARDAPVVADWLAPCGLVDAELTAFPYAFVDAAGCGGGVCLARRSLDCTVQACTVSCESDGDCPAGAVCEARDQSPDAARACRPGPQGTTPTELLCPA